MGDDRQAYRDQQPRAGKTQRAKRLAAVDAHGDHGRHDDAREARQHGQAVPQHSGIHADLRRPQSPRQIAGETQQRAVDHAQKQDGVGDIMFEEANHRSNRPRPPSWRTAIG